MREKDPTGESRADSAARHLAQAAFRWSPSPRRAVAMPSDGPSGSDARHMPKRGFAASTRGRDEHRRALTEAFAQEPPSIALVWSCFLTDGQASPRRDGSRASPPTPEHGRRKFRVFSFGVWRRRNTYLSTVSPIVRRGHDLNTSVRERTSSGRGYSGRQGSPFRGPPIDDYRRIWLSSLRLAPWSLLTCWPGEWSFLGDTVCGEWGVVCDGVKASERAQERIPYCSAIAPMMTRSQSSSCGRTQACTLSREIRCAVQTRKPWTR